MTSEKDVKEGVPALDPALDRCFDQRMRSRHRLVHAVLGLAIAAASPPVLAQVGGSVPDQVRRRQEAASLARHGYEVDWRTATWEELHDWNLRAVEVKGIRDRCNANPDWRQYSLADLRDWNARCSRAAALAKL